MLKEMIKKPFIQLNIEAKNWEEAVRKSFLPFLKEGFINEDYISAVINNVKSSGPYFVLAPGIALPHARPEEGALKNGIGIVTLKEPVVFGSKENDPVKYLFPLSGTNGESHMESLASLADLLEDENFFKKLNESTSENELLDYL